MLYLSFLRSRYFKAIVSDLTTITTNTTTTAMIIPDNLIDHQQLNLSLVHYNLTILAVMPHRCHNITTDCIYYTLFLMTYVDDVIKREY